MPVSTFKRARRRMSHSLSPSSLRAATRVMMGHGEAVNTNHESLPDASPAVRPTTAGGGPESGAHAGGAGIKRLGRRRTMSINFGNNSGIRRSASQKSCTGGKRELYCKVYLRYTRVVNDITRRPRNRGHSGFMSFLWPISKLQAMFYFSLYSHPGREFQRRLSVTCRIQPT